VVNGLPLANPLHRAEPVWEPDAEGPARITVIDADERDAAVEVVVRAESNPNRKRP
jgi:membrane carboxypeptidase/penicillin-binding protein PbpC